MWATLPAVLTLLFAAIYLSDRARGGYRIERIHDAAHASARTS
jgi:hypothetical protein